MDWFAGLFDVAYGFLDQVMICWDELLDLLLPFRRRRRYHDR
jgi:hypothetical protein